MLSSFFNRSFSNSSVFNVTSAAASQIKELLKNDFENRYLRIGLKEGGCAGFSFEFKFDNKLGEGDRLFNDQVILDNKSLFYLRDATLDFEKSNFSSSFRIDLPKRNQFHTCGCGKSVGDKHGTCSH